MKKGLLFLIVGALGFGFTACDKIDEIENFAIDHKFEHPIEFMVPAGGPTTTSEDFEIDPSSNADFKDNLSKISGYTVKSLSYRVPKYTGDASIMGTAVVVIMSNGVQVGSTIELGVIQFQQMLDSGDEMEVAVDDAMKTKIQDLLVANNKLSIRVMTEITDTPVDVTLMMGLELEAAVKVN